MKEEFDLEELRPRIMADAELAPLQIWLETILQMRPLVPMSDKLMRAAFGFLEVLTDEISEGVEERVRSARQQLEN